MLTDETNRLDAKQEKKKEGSDGAQRLRLIMRALGIRNYAVVVRGNQRFCRREDRFSRPSNKAENAQLRDPIRRDARRKDVLLEWCCSNEIRTDKNAIYTYAYISIFISLGSFKYIKYKIVFFFLHNLYDKYFMHNTEKKEKVLFVEGTNIRGLATRN